MFRAGASGGAQSTKEGRTWGARDNPKAVKRRPGIWAHDVRLLSHLMNGVPVHQCNMILGVRCDSIPVPKLNLVSSRPSKYWAAMPRNRNPRQ